MWRVLLIAAVGCGACTFQINALEALETGRQGDLSGGVPDAAPSSDDGGAPDLGGPAPDLAGIDLAPDPGCGVVAHSFAADPGATWQLSGDATHDPITGRVELTPDDRNAAGSAFYKVPLAVGSLHATFKVYIGDGDGADGLAFVVTRAAKVADLAPSAGGLSLGYRGMDGIAVELDTYTNLAEPSGEHVALCSAATGFHHASATPPKLDCDCVRTVDVRLKPDHVVVSIDGAPVLDQDLLPGVFSAGTYFLGFTAATGGFHNRHAVFDVHISSGPGDGCY